MSCLYSFSYQCPGCKTLLGYTLGDCEGGLEWTDGYCADLEPSVNIPVFQCPACEEIHWSNSCMLGTGFDPSPADTLRVQPPSETALLDAIENGLARDRPGEYIARQLAWWRRNDACRWDNRQVLPPPGAAAIRNLEWLQDFAQQARLPYDQELNSAGLVVASFQGTLLSSLRRHNLIEVELLRNLGRFDQALERLDDLTRIKFASSALDGEVRSLVDYSRLLCLARDTRVRPTSDEAAEQIDILVRFG